MAKSATMKWLITLESISIGSNGNTDIKGTTLMFNKLGPWLKEHNTEISWWIIGWMSFATIDSLVRGNYGIALLDAVLAGANYYFWRYRDV